jgi:hypothetical protein
VANIKRANASGITKPGTAIADVPDAPTIGTATGGQGAATVTYTAAATGGTATTFTATSTPGSITGTGASPITISGLTNGTAYSFTVTASNSTGTSPASSASNQVTPISLGDMDPIAMVEVGSAGSATISFTSIPATYKHLQIRGIARTARTEPNDYIYLRFNSDSGNNYAWHDLEGDGSTAVAQGTASTAQIFTLFTTTANSGASMFGAGIIDILDYANTNKYKTVRTLSGNDRNGSGYVVFGSGLWQNTNAVSTITLTNHGATNFQQYSQFALYGIKGA